MDFFSINNVMVNIPLGEVGMRCRGLRLSAPSLAYCASGAPAGKNR